MVREAIITPLVESTVTQTLAEVLHIKQNPTLDFAEKIYIGLLCRNTKIEELADGSFHLIDSENFNLLRSLVYQEARKLSFEEVLAQLNPQRTRKDIHNQMMQCKEDPLKTFLHTQPGFLLRAIQGNYIKDIVQEDVSTNCLETSLVLGLIAKLFYQDEGLQVFPMGFTDKLHGNATRHFMIFWTKHSSNKTDSSYFLTRYESRTWELNRKYMDELRDGNMNLQGIYEELCKMFNWLKPSNS